VEGEGGMLEKIDSQYGYVRKVLSCLVVFAIVISVVPWVVMAHDVSYSIAESKHIQEQAAAKEFKSQAKYLKSQASTTNTIAVVSTYNTILDDLDELVSNGKIPGYDLYTDSNIDDLWTNLDQYKILLIDEDCMFDWTNPGPDPNKPIPVTTIGKSFYDNNETLKQWIYKGGRLFSTDQNDISPDYTHNVWWTWLPKDLQVESNEYPSDYPEIGYGHYPDNLTIVYDPWIFSYPNKIDITKVDKKECHGRFTKYPGYQALVRDKSDGDVLEIYRTYGKGIIVLSHLEYETADIVDPTDGRTWDSKYIENEIFGLERKDVNLELYIEDANKEVLVNKAPGDLIDIVAQLKNNEKEDCNVKVTIQVPADFELKKNFTRNNFTDLNEVTVSSNDLGGGKYEVTTLVKSEEAKQVVWRFKIPDNYRVGPVSINGDVRVNGRFCDGDQIKFNVTNNIMSIIVTNRKLLFEKYGDKVIKGGSDDVLKLLRELYFLSDWRTYTGASGIVYYVDHYNETAKNWDQNVDYTNEDTANKVANIIDDYIEEWAEKLAIKKYWGPFLVKKSYPYLMIVGGDEIIPFYRAYHHWHLVGGGRGANHEPDFGYHNDPVLYSYYKNYYLTDMKYANLDEDIFGHDTTNDIELSPGRIVGHSAKDMKMLIERGMNGPKTSANAIAATITHNTDPLISVLRRKFNVLNDGKPAGELPITVASKDWNEDMIFDLMKNNDFSIFVHEQHSNYFTLGCPKPPEIYDWNIAGSLADQGVRDALSNNKPFISSVGCHAGVVTDEASKTDEWNPQPDDCIAWAFINSGVSGYLGLTSYGFYGYDLPFALPIYSEKLHNYFYSFLIKDGGTTDSLGNSLKNAIRLYLFPYPYAQDTVGGIVTEEFHIYGVPWMRLDPLVSQLQEEEAEGSIEINISKPQLISENIFERTIEVNVVDYDISSADGFDILKIEGSDWLVRDGKPILPMIRIPIDLPLGAEIIDVSLTSTVSTPIGTYNIPCLGGKCTNVTGFYPSPIFAHSAIDCENHKKAGIILALAQYNPQTNETILYNYTKLELTYQTPIPVTITDFSLDKIEYTPGETINASVTVENVGSDDLTNLKANLSLKDPLGRIVASNEKSFDIASGESKTIYVTLTPNIPHGVYLAEMNILGSGVLASSSEYITIKTGEIVNFTCPSEVEGGDLANFTISFKNGYQTSVEATGVVYIYDKDNIKVGEIYSAPIQIPANSIYDINISWDTTGRKIGNYTASAVVLVESEQFGPEYCTFEIKQKPILHTDLPNVELVSADPTVASINVTSLNLSEINETYKPEECIAPQSAYMINSTGAGNFTLKFTDIPNANTIIVYKINATNQWIELDATTTADTVTFTMSVGDPPVVFCSGAPPAAARVSTLTPIGIIALAGLLLVIGISRIKKRK